MKTGDEKHRSGFRNSDGNRSHADITNDNDISKKKNDSKSGSNIRNTSLRFTRDAPKDNEDMPCPADRAHERAWASGQTRCAKVLPPEQNKTNQRSVESQWRHEKTEGLPQYLLSQSTKNDAANSSLLSTPSTSPGQLTPFTGRGNCGFPLLCPREGPCWPIVVTDPSSPSSSGAPISSANTSVFLWMWRDANGGRLTITVGGSFSLLLLLLLGE